MVEKGIIGGKENGLVHVERNVTGKQKNEYEITKGGKIDGAAANPSEKPHHGASQGSPNLGEPPTQIRQASLGNSQQDNTYMLEVFK